MLSTETGSAEQAASKTIERTETGRLLAAWTSPRVPLEHWGILVFRLLAQNIWQIVLWSGNHEGLPLYLVLADFSLWLPVLSLSGLDSILSAVEARAGPCPVAACRIWGKLHKEVLPCSSASLKCMGCCQELTHLIVKNKKVLIIKHFKCHIL